MPLPTEPSTATRSMSCKRQYEQRVREIEHTSFTPLVLSATGGMASEATVFLQEACLLLGHQMGSTLEPNNVLATMPGCLLPPSVDNSVHQGTCYGHAAKSQTPPTDLVISETNFI